MTTPTLANIRFAVNLLADLKETVEVGNGTFSAQGLSFSPATALGHGTSANQADRFMYDIGRAITSGSSFDLDLFDFASVDSGRGAGIDAMGNAVTLAKVVGIIIASSAASAGVLEVGGKADATAWVSLLKANTDIAIVRPGGVIAAFAPDATAYGVTDSTNHILKLAAVGGNVTLDFVVLGRSA